MAACPQVVAEKTPAYYEMLNPTVAGLVPAEARAILDVGCGAGALGRHLRSVRPSCTVVGVELVEAAAALAAEAYDEVLVGDIEQLMPLPFEPGAFDCVVFADVLEHLRNPEKVLAGIGRWVREGGCVVACLPNVAHWSVAIPLLQGRFDYAAAGILDDTHLRFFTPATFAEMAFRAGWRSKRCECRMLPPDDAVGNLLAQIGHALGQDAQWASVLTATYQHVHLLQRAS